MLYWGIILGFYTEFDNIDGRTKINTELYNGKYTAIKSKYGEIINSIKYQKESISSYINDLIEQYIPKMQLIIEYNLSKNYDTCITYIPSSTSSLPQNLAQHLANNFNIPLKDIIYKDNSVGVSKGAENFSQSIELASQKYSIDEHTVSTNERYIIIDDVMGYGASIAVTLKLLYNKTRHPNFFLCIAKDVGR